MADGIYRVLHLDYDAGREEWIRPAHVEAGGAAHVQRDKPGDASDEGFLDDRRSGDRQRNHGCVAIGGDPAAVILILSV